MTCQEAMRSIGVVGAPAVVVGGKDAPAMVPLRRFSSSGVLAVGRPRAPAGATKSVGVKANAAFSSADNTQSPDSCLCG